MKENKLYKRKARGQYKFAMIQKKKGEMIEYICGDLNEGTFVPRTNKLTRTKTNFNSAYKKYVAK